MSHAQEMCEILGDPAIYEFENGPPESQEWLKNRFRKLETRRSPDGLEQWLNWVIRLPTGQLAGYAQATVQPQGPAYVAYELASRYWRQGIGGAAVTAVIHELCTTYQVCACVAVFKASNYRSQALLRHLAFVSAPPAGVGPIEVEADELAMYRLCGCGANAV